MAADSLGKSLGLIAAFCFTFAGAHAGPLEGLRAVAQLPRIDPAKLQRGEIYTQRGPDENFARGISLESCYFIAAPPATVSAR
ncbi:MAG: hypothetical protein ACR2MW_10765, partial [Chthoniobacterales bacterium]